MEKQYTYFWMRLQKTFPQPIFGDFFAAIFRKYAFLANQNFFLFSCARSSHHMGRLQVFGKRERIHLDCIIPESLGLLDIPSLLGREQP